MNRTPKAGDLIRDVSNREWKDKDDTVFFLLRIYKTREIVERPPGYEDVPTYYVKLLYLHSRRIVETKVIPIWWMVNWQLLSECDR